MRHLVLPTPVGAAVLDANRIDSIEVTGKDTCHIHLKATPSDKVKPGDHNELDVKLSALELRTAIAGMDDGDIYDPWNLDMLSTRDWL